MAGRVDVAEIQGQETRPLRRRQIQPGERRVDTFRVWSIFIVRLPERWAHPENFSFRSGKEITCGSLALLLGSHPNWFATPPAGILNCGFVSHRKGGFEVWIIDVISNDAMIFGIETSRDRVMVRKGQRRKRWSHPFRLNAFSSKRREIWRLILREVIKAKCIDRDQYEGWLAPLL